EMKAPMQRSQSQLPPVAISAEKKPSPAVLESALRQVASTLNDPVSGLGLQRSESLPSVSFATVSTDQLQGCRPEAAEGAQRSRPVLKTARTWSAASPEPDEPLSPTRLRD
ncbi:unnamed protein product, partial [Polarella glacialis]